MTVHNISYVIPPSVEGGIKSKRLRFIIAYKCQNIFPSEQKETINEPRGKQNEQDGRQGDRVKLQTDSHTYNPLFYEKLLLTISVM